MKKSELVALVAEKSELSKKDAEASVNSLVEALTDALSKGDKVTLAGFGTFEVKERAARKGRNPATGEEIDIKASRNVKFKAAKALKDSV